MIETWPLARFPRELRDRPRVLVLFAGKGPRSRAFLPVFEGAEPEANVPFALAQIDRLDDPRRREHRVRTLPTLIYFEHGEELERMDGIPGRGLALRDLEELLAQIDAIEEEPLLPKRMHGPRRR